MAGGDPPIGRADAVDAEFALRLMRHAIKWYAVPGDRRFSAANERRDHDRERPDSDQRAAIKTQANQFTLPPDAMLIRRMHGIVAIVLQQLGPARIGGRSRRSTCMERRPRRRSGGQKVIF